MTTSTAGEREQRRAALLPADISYPDLPVSAVREELTAAIRDNQVVVVAGETGSGKTTQLPKMCLELGRGVRGMIAHTQPRRIAARAVAERVAEELGVELGSTVGYTVRFADRVGPDTLLRVMTDGVLLAEISSDPTLARYDTVIVDEAHERSLTIDFLLGYLKQLLPRRPDLKVVITSATIDTERFAAHFGDAPVVTVTGRTYPVQLRYRPVVDPDDPATADRDQTQAVCDAVAELAAAGPGDVLVFLSGEREIRDTADALRGLVSRDTEVLPLYGRLSAEEQHRVFAPHTGRRVVLATNVAETSLTVPGIRYVVDAGTARISRWSRRTKVQRLPIEPVSRASADQRAGRCGRVADGICIRLYDEADYESRPEYAEPEILRTDLAAIVLRMTALGLGDVAAFPFLDPPDRRDVRSALDLLAELGALEPGRPGDVPRLTRVGRHLARLPVDPRLARMLLAADADGCLAEMLVIVAGLSIQDPRERPADAQQAAVDAHRRFAVDGSDFLAYLRLWEYLRDRQEALSSSAFRRMCRAEYLHYLRIREWQDLHAQLRRATRDLGARPNASPAAEEAVHRAVLAGLLSHVGLRDPATGDYAGARGTRFQLSPGSVLARRGPRWVVAAELVETSRLWGRVAARVQPEWVERLAGHLVQRSYSEPHWDAGRGAVMASERVTLYGLPLVAARPVTYSRVDPALCRELFMQHALVEGDWRTFHAFASHNRSLLTEVGELEERVRRHDLRVRDTVLYDFFDTRIPADVVSARSFDSWWKRERHRHPDLLDLPRSLLVDAGAEERVRRDFPGALPAGGGELPLAYRFSPGADDDGVTVRVPLGVLNRLRPGEVDAAVPGLREELVTALLRSLPKDLRRRLGPAPDLARTVASRLAPGTPLLDALEHELRRETGVGVPRDAWHPERLPDHLRLRYEVRDDRGAVVGADRDLAGLQRRLAREVQAALARAAGGLEREGLRTWPGATLPRSSTAATAWRCARWPARPSSTPRWRSAPGACSSWRLRTPSAASRRGSVTGGCWASPGRRTRRSRRCSPTAPAPPSTASSPGSAARSGTRRDSSGCGRRCARSCPTRRTASRRPRSRSSRPPRRWNGRSPSCGPLPPPGPRRRSGHSSPPCSTRGSSARRARPACRTSPATSAPRSAGSTRRGSTRPGTGCWPGGSGRSRRSTRGWRDGCRRTARPGTVWPRCGGWSRSCASACSRRSCARGSRCPRQGSSGRWTSSRPDLPATCPRHLRLPVCRPRGAPGRVRDVHRDPVERRHVDLRLVASAVCPGR